MLIHNQAWWATMHQQMSSIAERQQLVVLAYDSMHKGGVQFQGVSELHRAEQSGYV